MAEEVFRFLPCTFGHSEAWTPRDEALMEAVVNRREPPGIPLWWIVTPTWILQICRRVCGSKKSACSSKLQKKEFPLADPLAQRLIVRTYDYVGIAHKTATFLVVRDQEIHEVRD